MTKRLRLRERSTRDVRCGRLFVRRGAMVLAGWLVIASRIGSGGAAASPATYPECGVCHMPVADQRFAIELVAPSGESHLFDDMACLESYLRPMPAEAGTQVFVSDHRTGARIPLGQAVLTAVERVTGPMGSPILAHESALSRDGDPDAAYGRPVDRAEALGFLRPR